MSASARILFSRRERNKKHQPEEDNESGDDAIYGGAGVGTACRSSGLGRRQGGADVELVRLWRARAVLLRQGKRHLRRGEYRSRNPGRPRLGRDHAGGG